MTLSHDVTQSEIGMVRIYLKPSDKVPGSRRRLWPARPLYRMLVAQAKAEGLMNAIAHHTHYGYSNHGAVRTGNAETVDPHLTLCVEMIAPRGDLEAFCRRHGDWLADKVIVYKQLEQWTVAPAGDAAC